jgi:Beta-lactamase
MPPSPVGPITLEASVDRVAAETGFSGVVRVDRGDDVQLAKAYGLAHRGCQIANAVDTRFAIASGTKGSTALTVVKLIEEDRLGRSRSTSRSSSPREGPAPAPTRPTISTWGRRCRGRSSRPRTAGKPTTGCRGDRR